VAACPDDGTDQDFTEAQKRQNGRTDPCSENAAISTKPVTSAFGNRARRAVREGLASKTKPENAAISKGADVSEAIDHRV
jgi:hypothetical protein